MVSHEFEAVLWDEPIPAAATELLGKKVALAARDWDFASAGIILNSSYGPLQVEKQLPCSCFMLFGVWWFAVVFFFFFLFRFFFFSLLMLGT